MSTIKDIFSKYKKIIFKNSNELKNNEEAEEIALVKREDKKTKGVKNKKKIENIATFIVILIITVIMINKIIKGDSKDNSDNKSSSQYKQFVENNNKNDSTAVANISVQTDLEKELEDILTRMQGVGEVKVLITYSQTSQIVPIYNETNKNSSTQEEDSTGGTRHSLESDIKKEVVMDSNNDIITESIMLPKIEGAIVIAKGADRIEIKNNIIQAVCAVTGLSNHKVQVFELNND